MLRRIFMCLSIFLFTSAILTESIVCKADATTGAPAFSDSEKAYVETAGTLKVGYVQDRIPVSFSDRNGELSGISRYIFDRIQEISGLTFEYVPLSAGAVTYDYLMSEGLNLVTSVEYNKENLGAKGIMMSDPYLSSRKVVVARRDLTFSYDANLSVAVSSGSQTIKKVLHETYPNYSIVDYPSIEDCFSAVNSGKTDLMIMNQYVVEYWLYKPSYENLKVIPILDTDDLLCFSAVVPFDENGNPASSAGDTLISILNKSIAQMTEEELDSFTIQAIMENRYSFTPLDFLYRYRYALVILSAAFLLIVALVVLLLRQRLQSVEAKADARAKSRFLSTMSHEVRTPLNGLIGLNYLMAHKLHDEEQLARYLHQSTTTANYLLALVSDILDMSMLHNGDFKIEHKPMDLRLLLSTVETIVQNGMKEKNILFQTDISLPYANIIGDEVRIQQILLNLLDNAKKFTPEGGKVTVSACQTLEESGKIHTEIHVSDTGKGMSKAFQDNIFDAFAQERDTVSKGDEGVGLGLSICHRLAKLMDGDISFVSQPNKGSTFTFFFPAEPADTPAAEKATAFVPPQDKPCILIAEDNELNGEIMLELLSENEYDAKLAVNGREALDLFSSSEYGTYGVILMDLLMPEMDGFEATAAIRALDRPDAKTVKILACSANCTVEDQKKAFACGMDDFLAKPIDIDVLLGKLTV